MRRRRVLAGFLLLVALPATGARAQTCADCDGDPGVSVVDIVGVVRTVLAMGTPCMEADINGDGSVSVDDAVLGVGNAAQCSAAVATATPTATPSPTPPPGDNQAPPTQAQALRSWLQEGRYLGWHAESQIHPSGGPHFGLVRTYLNDLAFDSLVAGNAQHPKGAAVIKELYHSGSTIQEWAVEIKLEADSAGGQNWYWYEGVGLSGRGLRICTNCHGRDYVTFKTKDFILTPFPLQ